MFFWAHCFLPFNTSRGEIMARWAESMEKQFDIVYTVHRNQLRKQTNKMHFMYLFYNFCTNLHVSKDHFVHHQEFMIYCILQLCTNHALHGLYRAAEYSKSWTPDDERNGRSKHVDLYKNCRINTYRKCILLVSLHNWLRCTVHTMSNVTSLILVNMSVCFGVNCCHYILHWRWIHFLPKYW